MLVNSALAVIRKQFTTPSPCSFWYLLRPSPVSSLFNIHSNEQNTIPSFSSMFQICEMSCPDPPDRGAPATHCSVLYCTALYCTRVPGPGDGLHQLLRLEAGAVALPSHHLPQLYCTVLYCTVLYCTVMQCNILYCNVLYCNIMYCTVLYCTAM